MIVQSEGKRTWETEKAPEKVAHGIDLLTRQEPKHGQKKMDELSQKTKGLGSGGLREIQNRRSWNKAVKEPEGKKGSAQRVTTRFKRQSSYRRWQDAELPSQSRSFKGNLHIHADPAGELTKSAEALVLHLLQN